MDEKSGIKFEKLKILIMDQENRVVGNWDEFGSTALM